MLKLKNEREEYGVVGDAVRLKNGEFGTYADGSIMHVGDVIEFEDGDDSIVVSTSNGYFIMGIRLDCANMSFGKTSSYQYKLVQKFYNVHKDFSVYGITIYNDSPHTIIVDGSEMKIDAELYNQIKKHEVK